jgi:hypothetical protein
MRNVNDQYFAVMRGIVVELRCCLHALAGTYQAYVDVYVWLVSAGDSQLLRLLDRAINSEKYPHLKLFGVFSTWLHRSLSVR